MLLRQAVCCQRTKASLFLQSQCARNNFEYWFFAPGSQTFDTHMQPCYAEIKGIMRMHHSYVSTTVAIAAMLEDERQGLCICMRTVVTGFLPGRGVSALGGSSVLVSCLSSAASLCSRRLLSKDHRGSFRRCSSGAAKGEPEASCKVARLLSNRKQQLQSYREGARTPGMTA